MKFEFLHKREFGNDRIYPVSKDSVVLLNLMGRSSLTKDQYKAIQSASWPVSIKPICFEDLPK